jgi:hypothetical protein
MQIRFAVQQMLDAIAQDGVVIEEGDFDHAPLCQRKSARTACRGCQQGG